MSELLNASNGELGFTDPSQEILEKLPEHFRSDPVVQDFAKDQAIWVNDGRTSALKASKFILERLSVK